MKNLLIISIIAIALPWTTNAQDIEILNITQNELPTHSGLTDDGIFYTVTQPNTFGGGIGQGFTDAKITRFNANGIPMDDIFIPNENPGNTTVNNVYFYANPQNDDFIATAKTWGSSNGTILWSESLFFFNDDLTINETAPRLVSFGGFYYGPVIIDNKVYVLWAQSKSFSKLIYNDVDNSENLTSLIPNTHPDNSLWLLEIGNADDNRGTLLNYYPVGDTSIAIAVVGSTIDGFQNRKIK